MTQEHKAGEFCWNELATRNVKEAKEFYSKSFGWQFSDHQIGDSTYSMIKCGGQEFGGMWQIPHDQTDIPPHWMSYILVDNLEQSLDTVKKNGAQVKVPTTKAGEFGMFAIIIDPTGAHIALWQSLGDKSC